VVLPEVLEQPRVFGVGRPWNHCLQELLVGLGPDAHGKLGDLDRALVYLSPCTPHRVRSLVFARLGLDLAREPPVPRHELGQLLLLVPEHLADHRDQVLGVVVGHAGRPPGADPVAAIDQDEGDDGRVVFGLDALPVVVEVAEQLVVLRVE